MLAEGGGASVFKYRDYASCLDSVQARLRARRPELATYEKMGEALGIATRTQVKKMLKGQAPMPGAVGERLAELAGLGAPEGEYLKLLRRIHFCRDTEQAVLLSRKLLELKRAFGPRDEFTELEERQLAVFEKWYLFPMLFYFRADEPRAATPLELARAFMGQLSPRELELGLLTLKALGLLTEERPGEWRRSALGLSLLDHAPRAVIRGYHKQMIGKALESVELEPEKRFLSGATLAIRAENLPKVRERISDFLKEMVELYGDSREGEEVHQLQAQFFPLLKR